jgi:hypothetical protein
MISGPSTANVSLGIAVFYYIPSVEENKRNQKEIGNFHNFLLYKFIIRR